MDVIVTTYLAPTARICTSPRRCIEISVARETRFPGRTSDRASASDTSPATRPGLFEAAGEVVAPCIVDNPPSEKQKRHNPKGRDVALRSDVCCLAPPDSDDNQ